ncbi:MAG: helix-turn-helix transcriptional regulator [Adlercreutzia sp.]|nr:helix-turn-helix transcriptional regulator [Adlercreutzia sp.]
MDHIHTIFSTLRPRTALLFAGYALYLVFSFMTFHSATVVSAVSAGGVGEGIYFMAPAMAARVGLSLAAALALFLLMRHRLAWATRPLEAALVAISAICVLVAALVLAMASSLGASAGEASLRPWLMVAGALMGAGDGAAVLLWAQFSSTLGMRRAYLFVILCNIASQGLYFGATALPTGFMLPLAVVLLVASVALSEASLVARKGADGDWVCEAPVLRQLARELWHPVLGTAILCFMGGLMLQISGQHEVPLGEFQLTSQWASALAALCLLVPALVVRKPLNLERLYGVALPLSAAGFLLLPLIWNAAGGLVNAFAQVGAMVAGIILWCMLADAAHRTRTSPVLLFSLAFIFTYASQLAGTVVGYLNADIIRPGDVALTTVALVSVYLLLMAALLLFRNRGAAAPAVNPVPSAIGDGSAVVSEGEASPAVAREEALAARCAELADRYDFTPRERDIFLLLAQGHTLPAISERLFVSENTVKSHVKRIYQKLGIHARSELIDLVNAPEGNEPSSR